MLWQDFKVKKSFVWLIKEEPILQLDAVQRDF
jgi:hypothetical protein